MRLHLDCPGLEPWREDVFHQLLRHLVGVSVALLEDVRDGLRLGEGRQEGTAEHGGVGRQDESFVVSLGEHRKYATAAMSLAKNAHTYDAHTPTEPGDCQVLSVG